MSSVDSRMCQRQEIFIFSSQEICQRQNRSLFSRQQICQGHKAHVFSRQQYVSKTKRFPSSVDSKFAKDTRLMSSVDSKFAKGKGEWYSYSLTYFRTIILSVFYTISLLMILSGIMMPIYFHVFMCKHLYFGYTDKSSKHFETPLIFIILPTEGSIVKSIILIKSQVKHKHFRKRVEY